MKDEELVTWARSGAKAELEKILDRFPDLLPARPAILADPPNGRRPLTDAERRAVSLRMKRYWRKRRRAAK
jgi:hypothetical protein